MSKFTKFIYLISLIIACYAIPLSAQSPIEIDEENVTIDFPDSITFELSVEGEANIENGTLVYGTNGRSCQEAGSKQAIDFDPGRSVDLSWEWELKRSGSLPPGAEIWWEWEIEDADGNIMTTERQTQLVLDERYAWRTLEEDGVVVNWIIGNEAFGESILLIAAEALALIANDMGVTEPPDIDIWVYPSGAEVRDALVYSSEWAGGVAFSDYGITIVGIAPDQDDWKRQVVPHELVHLVVGELMFNCYGAGLPVWLNEGLARYAETNIEARSLDQLQTALEAGKLPPLKTLAGGFSAYGGGASLAYTQSYVMVKYLIDEYGADQMLDLLNTVKEGNLIDDALESVYGFDTAGLDAQWRETVGFAATPTLASDALAAQATPTMIATIALVNPLASPPTLTPVPATISPVIATDEPAPTPELTATSASSVDNTVISDSSDDFATPVATVETMPDPLADDSNRLPLIVVAVLVVGLLIGSFAFFLGKRRS